MQEISGSINWLLTHYGSLPLFFLLAFGIIGLPIPDETLLALAGFMVSQNKLPLFTTFLAVYFGSICGITVNYLLGRTAAKLLIEKYGPHIGITHRKLQHAHTWFERTGKWTLFIGYFIPGVRHLTGYVAGSTKVSYRIFALFAYSGGLIWVIVFLSLGYFFGDKIFALLSRFDRDITWLVLIIVVVFCLYYLFKYFRRAE